MHLRKLNCTECAESLHLMHIICSFSFELYKHWWIWHKPKTEISQLYMDKIVEWIFFHFKKFLRAYLFQISYKIIWLPALYSYCVTMHSIRTTLHTQIFIILFTHYVIQHFFKPSLAFVVLGKKSFIHG